jgi:hypothetical protein
MRAQPAPFPDLPAGFWRGTTAETAAAAFLDSVEAWRAATLTQLTQRSAGDHLSPSMVRLLRHVLDADPGAADPLPPRLGRFPDLARPGTSALADARAVLLWRAALVDFLADVWDVIGTPAYDLPDCAAAERRLLPHTTDGHDTDERDICRICLEPLARRDDAAGYVVHDHRCPALRALSIG